MICDLSAEELMVEAAYFYRAMFGQPPSDPFKQLYVAAHRDLSEFSGDAEAIGTVRRVVQNRLNALAVELALRRTDQRHLITRKMLLVSYIAECDGCHAGVFAQDNAPFYFWFILPWWGARALARLVWGRILVGLYALV